MAFVVPEHPRSLIDLAGDALIDFAGAVEYFEDTRGDPLLVINNWRLSHLYPLNTFQVTLRYRVKRVDATAIVAQRVKRLSSIEAKLRRFELRGDPLKLTDIQDLGGCRAIVNSVANVYEVVDGYLSGYSDHKLDDQDDYIRRPKSDGYRGYHLIYRYFNENHPAYDHLKIEMQIRSALQHSWATAVETVDTFLREGLKAHGGSPEWRRFFALMGSAIALREGTRRVPKTPSDPFELKKELREYVEMLQVVPRLEAFQQTLSVAAEARGSRVKWVVMELDPRMGTPSLRLYGYTDKSLDDAARRMETLESHLAKGVDAVLVSVAQAGALRYAYPNYFLDTTAFISAVNEAISE